MNNIRLLNGDALDTLKKLIKENIKVDAIITDIPYGYTLAEWDELISMKEMWHLLNKIKKNKNTPIILFSAGKFTPLLQMSNFKEFKYVIHWLKTQGSDYPNAKIKPLNAVEDINVFYEKPPTYNPQKTFGSYIKEAKAGQHQTKTLNQKGFTENYVKPASNTRFPLNYQLFSRDMDIESKGLHPTQKPIALMEWLIKSYSNEGDTILDFTMGSGTTGYAAKKLLRNFIGIELNKEYYDIAVKRIEELKSAQMELF